ELEEQVRVAGLGGPELAPQRGELGRALLRGRGQELEALERAPLDQRPYEKPVDEVRRAALGVREQTLRVRISPHGLERAAEAHEVAVHELEMAQLVEGVGR